MRSFHIVTILNSMLLTWWHNFSLLIGLAVVLLYKILCHTYWFVECTIFSVRLQSRWFFSLSLADIHISYISCTSLKWPCVLYLKISKHWESSATTDHVIRLYSVYFLYLRMGSCILSSKKCLCLFISCKLDYDYVVGFRGW